MPGHGALYRRRNACRRGVRGERCPYDCAARRRSIRSVHRCRRSVRDGRTVRRARIGFAVGVVAGARCSRRASDCSATALSFARVFAAARRASRTRPLAVGCIHGSGRHVVRGNDYRGCAAGRQPCDCWCDCMGRPLVDAKGRCRGTDQVRDRGSAAISRCTGEHTIAGHGDARAGSDVRGRRTGAG